MKFQLNNFILLIVTTVICLLVLAVAGNWVCNVVGLGDTVLYDNNPIYGYRPLPNQKFHYRFPETTVSFNNLGLRAAKDWDGKPEGKVLFVGDSVTYGGRYVDDSQLFSTLCQDYLPSIETGNAGVNGWGILNIHGLIVNTDFFPAETYVLTIPLEDFYRGLTRIHGAPFNNNQPQFALMGLVQHLAYVINNGRYTYWPHIADERVIRKSLEIAALALQNIIVDIKSRGMQVIVFITPSFEEAVNPKMDPAIRDLLDTHDISYHFLGDKLATLKLKRHEIEELYVDSVHLSEKGHKTWASLMAPQLKQLIE